jgi:branched-chain amino acid transport system substrate-binding protein
MGSRNGLRGRWLSLALICGVAVFALAACGSSSKSSSTGGGGATTSAGGSTTASSSASSSGGSTDTSSCGPTPGKAATGTPINLGTINTKQPGTDFTDQANMAQAFFTCLNANGGVNGHPVKYFQEDD